MTHRIERIGDCELHLADCRDVLPLIGPVDAVVTDPPYGIGFKYSTHVDDREGYPNFIWPILKAAEDCLSPGGPMFVWQSQQWMHHFHEIFPRNWRIFVAAKTFVQMMPSAMQAAYDPVVVWWKDGAKPWTKGTANRDFHITNTASLVSNTKALERSHPCPRPLQQVCHVVEQWVPPFAKVLDPFMGSGTTGVACARTGRKFIGCEIDSAYFDIACRRIEEAYRQPDLFVSAPLRPTAEQLNLLEAYA